MKLQDLANIKRGIEINKSLLINVKDEYLYLTINEIRANKIIVNNDSKYISERKLKNNLSNYKNSILNYGDFLVIEDKNFTLIENKESFKIIVESNFLIFSPINSFLTNYLRNVDNQIYFLNVIKFNLRKSETEHLIENLRNIEIEINSYDIENTTQGTSIKDDRIDASLISITQKTLPLDKILKRIAREEIDLNTFSQRKFGLWTDEIKSRLIESLIVGIPIPAFYFDGSNNDKWLIIDGLQRISAVNEFVIEKTLRLNSLFYLDNDKFLGKSFDDLGRADQRTIEEYEIIAYIINAGTPKNLKFKLFQSINTSALRLERQEIRHALNPAKPTEILMKIVELSNFKTNISDKLNVELIDRMYDRELALIYVSFRITHFIDYKPHLQDFLDYSMNLIYKIPDNVLEKYFLDLEHTLLICNQIFGENAFKRNMFEDKKNYPFNATLFCVFSVTISELEFEKRIELSEKKEIFITNLQKNKLGFEKTIENDTKELMINRFNLLEKIIKETLNYATKIKNRKL